LPIDWEAPCFVEIVGITEDRFAAEIDLRKAGDEFVLLGVITGFDEGLRIDVAVRRPINESGREQIRLFLNQRELGPENQLVRPETFEDSDLSRFFDPGFAGSTKDLPRLANQASRFD
jgi:hypothetical protein